MMGENQNSRQAFEAFETFSTAFKMKVKMHSRVIAALLMLQIIVFIINVKVTTGYNLYNMSLCIKHMVYAAYYGTNMNPVIRQLTINWIILFIAIVALPYPMILIMFQRRSETQSEKKYIRGAKLVHPDELKREFKRRKEALDLPLGSIKMPVFLENRNTCIIGLPGSGKSQCFRRILKRLYERGDKGIIHDPKGEYFSEFYNQKTDLLFNPLDQRSLGWNIFNELNSYPDVDAVAASLIPPAVSVAGGVDPFWPAAASGVFSGILHYLYQNRKCTNSDLWELLTAEAIDLSRKLKSTKGGEAGYRYISQNAKNTKQAESVLAVAMQYTKCFEYMTKSDGDFRIMDWLKDRRPGMIYVTNYKDIEETLKPILSLFIDLMSRKLLSMPDDLSRRIFLLLDEFGRLQRLPSIVNLLTEGRSKGACSFIGIQDDGQIEKIYSAQIRKTIDNACANRITFALTGETAEKETKYNIGEVEFDRFRRSYTMGPVDLRDGMSLTEERRREPLLLPSDLTNLKDLTALVRLRNYNFTLSQWQWEEADQRYDRFSLRKDLMLENMLNEQKVIRAKVDRLVKNENRQNREVALDIKPVA